MGYFRHLFCFFINVISLRMGQIQKYHCCMPLIDIKRLITLLFPMLPWDSISPYRSNDSMNHTRSMSRPCKPSCRRLLFLKRQTHSVDRRYLIICTYSRRQLLFYLSIHIYISRHCFNSLHFVPENLLYWKRRQWPVVV